MNREILFKGYQKELKKWVFGNLVKLPNGACFILDYQSNFEDRIEVSPDSVCQYIGKSDKANTKIYEGDYDADGNCVVWCEECNGFEFAAIDVSTKEIYIPCHRCEGDFIFAEHIERFEIIGNAQESIVKQIYQELISETNTAAKSKSLHAIKMAEDYLKSFQGFWNEFEKLPEGFRFLLLNNMANYAEQQCSAQRGLCQQEIWKSKSAIAQTDSWVVSPKKLDLIILNAPDPVDINLIPFSD